MAPGNRTVAGPAASPALGELDLLEIEPTRRKIKVFEYLPQLREAMRKLTGRKEEAIYLRAA